jgi:hypothetical protein
MQPPRPFVVAIVIAVLALIRVGGQRDLATPRGVGYIIGTLIVAAVVLFAYAWWYGRRQRID